MVMVGLSLCHTSRGRILVVTGCLGIACVLMLVYYTRPLTSSLFPLDQGSVAKVSQVRQDKAEFTLMGAESSSRKPASIHSSGSLMKRFPGAIIIGARKGGTRALINMLKLHPSIVTAVNEVHYFDRDANFAKGVQWYINQMPYSSSSQITIEKSPSYFVSGATPRRIHTLSPNQKLIFIVRNPVHRTVSDYTQLTSKGTGKTHRTFEGEVFMSPSGEVNTRFSPISVSMYDVHFVKWLRYFRLEQVLVVDGDSLIRDPVVELKKVEKFLAVDNFFTNKMFYFNATKGFHCWKKATKSGKAVPLCLGSAKGRQHPKLSGDTEQKLLDFFEPHNRQFFQLVGREFDWTLHSR